MLVMARGRSNSFIGKIEKSTVVDAATIGVLVFNAYVIYGSLGHRVDLTDFAASTEVLAIQLTGAAVVLYALEFMYDRVKGRNSSPLG